MKHFRSTTFAAAAVLTSLLWLAGGCDRSYTSAQAGSSSGGTGSSAKHSVPAGTRIAVTLGSTLSSETARVGETWRGTVTNSVATTSGLSIPAGSRVDGEVVGVTAAKRGSRAMLQLGMTRIQIDGDERAISASAEPVIAGSTRKRNVGAIAGGALAGALIGNNVGDGRNAAAGGLIGGAAATGVVAASKGFQVELAGGSVVHFTVIETVAVR